MLLVGINLFLQTWNANNVFFILFLEKPMKWIMILEKLYLPVNLDLYQFCYQPLISERIKDIIQTAWRTTIEDTERKVNELIEQEPLTKGRGDQLKWTVDPSDIPLSLKQVLTGNKQCHKLLMKTKGYTAGIINVCQFLDESLQTMFNDVTLYLQNQQDTSSGLGIQILTMVVERDRTDVVQFLQQSSKEGISEYNIYIPSI